MLRQVIGLNLSHLETFCEVAKSLNLTQAAERLHRTQPALSRQLSDLEHRICLKLFTRQGRGMKLTAAGEELYARSLAIVSATEDLAARARALASGHVGLLRAGAMTISLDVIMPAVLAEFRSRHPNVEVKLVEADTRELVAMVESGELDVALTRDVQNDSIASTRLFPMHVVAVFPAQHPLGGQATVEVRDLQEEPLLLTPPDTGSRVLLSQVCRAASLNLRHVRIESRSYGGLVAMAQSGYGVAVVLSTVGLARPGILMTPVVHEGKGLDIWFSAVWHRRSDLPDHAQAFIAVAEEITRFIPAASRIC